MIGCSGMAGRGVDWLSERLDERVEIAGLVDVNKEVLGDRGGKLGLNDDQLFTDYEEACAKVKADFCGIAAPPQFHDFSVSRESRDLSYSRDETYLIRKPRISASQ